ncbi:MAG: ABC transporter substrate-binding protein [Desulfovibrionaceae bacterium]|nr:ABC transporter substrate-binding protein [Desulfovibrionaceae bacterium]
MCKRILLALLALGLFAAPALAAQKSYINGIDANYPPHAYVEAGQPTGFDVEALNWIAKKMDFEIKHVPMDWDTIVASLLAKKIDMVCSGMSITQERQARVNFSEPYFSVRKVLVVRDDSKLTRDQILQDNKKLGVQRGTNEAETLENSKAPNSWNYTLTYYDSAPLAVEDLINGRVDAAAMDSAPANDAIKRGKKPVRVVGEFADPDDFGVAIRKEDAELLKMINEGFKLLTQDPFWQELQEKYDSLQ